MEGFPNSGACSIAVARNREPILAVLRRILPARGVVLEIASGTGEHAVHFAAGLPHLTWQPSDHDRDALHSIAAHRASTQLPNLLAPVELDASARAWPLARAEASSSTGANRFGSWADARCAAMLWRASGSWSLGCHVR